MSGGYCKLSRLCIGITQSLTEFLTHGEIRQSLDVNWLRLFSELDFTPVMLPYLVDLKLSAYVESLNLKGVVLSGGNDLSAYSSPEQFHLCETRDQYEKTIMEYCYQKDVPVLGACRGAQFINHFLGGTLEQVSDHVLTGGHKIIQMSCFSDMTLPERVNSYHNFGINTSGLADPLKVVALDETGHVEAFVHQRKRILGIMWHPERAAEASPLNNQIISEFFS